MAESIPLDDVEPLDFSGYSEEEAAILEAEPWHPVDIPPSTLAPRDRPADPWPTGDR